MQINKEDRTMEKAEMVEVLVSREMADAMFQEKLSRDAVGGVMAGQMHMTLGNILSAKALLSVVGVDKAKEAVDKVIYDFMYELGKRKADELGNPTDLDSYLEAYLKEMDAIPPVPPLEIVERTKNRCVFGVKRCLYRDSIYKFKEDFPEYIDADTLEVLKYRCSHDHGWAIGFNPKMKFKRTKFLLDGDDGCYFEVEVP